MRSASSLLFVITVICLHNASQVQAQGDPLRVSPEGMAPNDARLGPLRNLNDHFHPWSPPTNRDAWEAEAQILREQILVGIGLWPLPEKTPLNAVVHGLIDQGDYTIEKVYFASRLGHYVCGNLYRPKGEGPFPGVLCPHGHWANGRFYDAGDGGAADQIATAAEEFESGAHSPLQARFVQLARMGCVVFHYDMVGYADSLAVPHREGYGDIAAQLELQCLMGLQTWNSIRSLDFLLTLDDVDPTRIAVTGASGGGTQTFMLCALDDRPVAAFPAVMVSTNMQGGCVCENACYLRNGINNVAIAALFAPKPMAMSGADDWTIDIETRGLPELKQVYALYGAASNVNAQCLPQFPHNYNQPSREMMYNFFNEALDLGIEGPIVQTDFEVLTPEELSVFDAEHPVPDDALSVEDLRAMMVGESRATLMSSLIGNGDAYRDAVGTAARVMLDQGVPVKDNLEGGITEVSALDGYALLKATVGRLGSGESIPIVALHAVNGATGEAVLWIHPDGKSSLLDESGGVRDEVAQLLDAGYAVVAPDLFLTGEYLTDGRSDQLEVDAGFPAYTFCYNRPLLSQRVRDILTVIAAVHTQDQVTAIHLVGLEEAGPWAALAGALAGDSIRTTTADLQHFSFTDITEANDPMLLPGATKYGGLDGLIALAAPRTLRLFGTSDDELFVTTRAYGNAEGLTVSEESLSLERLVELITSDDN